jgi:Carboxypeptidase regulatory-like domain
MRVRYAIAILELLGIGIFGSILLARATTSTAESIAFPRNPVAAGGEPARTSKAPSADAVAESGSPQSPPGGSTRDPAVASLDASLDASAAAAAIGRIVFGTVLDQAGRVVADASVSLARVVDRERETVSVGKTGTFAIAGLLPGVWSVRVRARGCLPIAEDLEVPADRRALRRDFRLQAARIVDVAFVTPEGDPLVETLRSEKIHSFRDIQVVVTTHQPPELVSHDWRSRLPFRSLARFIGERRSPRDGEVLPARFVGWFELKQPPPLFVSAYLGAVRLGSHPLADGQDEVSFAISVGDFRGSLADVRFRLVDAVTKKSITNADITLGGVSGVTPDANGAVPRIPRVPGRYGLTVRAPGYEIYHAIVDLHRGRSLDMGDLAIHPPVTGWKGKVLDASGKPTVARIRSRRHDLGDTKVARARMFHGCDADGGFALGSLGPRRYLLIASKGNDEELDWTVIDAGQRPTPIVFRLRKTVPVRFDNELGPFESRRLVVRDGRSRAVWSGRVTARSRRGPRLPLGSYTVEIRRTTGDSPTVPLVLTDSGGIIHLR